MGWLAVRAIPGPLLKGLFNVMLPDNLSAVTAGGKLQVLLPLLLERLFHMWSESDFLSLWKVKKEAGKQTGQIKALGAGMALWDCPCHRRSR